MDNKQPTSLLGTFTELWLLQKKAENSMKSLKNNKMIGAANDQKKLVTEE
uniref:Uncharacterized protein n=1 Tax=Arion vulgaris TaxID=1028688 RepID=A0A0B7AL69_9EUPU